MPLNKLNNFLRSRFKIFRGHGSPDTATSVQIASHGDLAETINQAFSIHQQGKLEDAESLYRDLLRQAPDDANIMQLLGVVLAQRGDLKGSEAMLDRSIAREPGDASTHVNRGNVLRAMFRRQEALLSYDRALELSPTKLEAWVNRAALRLELGLHDGALLDYESILRLDPDNREVRLRRCELLEALNRLDDALAAYEQALQGDSSDVDLLFHCGVLLVRLRRYPEAVKRYDQVLSFKPDYAEVLNNRGIALWRQRLHQEAIKSYDRAIEVRPDYADAHYNRGIALTGLNQHEAALSSYERAIEANPEYARAYSNRGAALAKLGRHEAALVSYDRALELDPRLADALNNRGGIFRRMGLHERAAQDYAHLLELDADYEHAVGNLFFSDAWYCGWDRFSDSKKELEAALRKGKPAALPFQAAVMMDDPSSQLCCARLHSSRKYPSADPHGFPAGSYRHDRPRIAYLSSDFHDHATSQLMAELFERHDRDLFEISAWSFGPESGDAMRVRLQAAFEHFHDVRTVSDDEVVARLRAGEIDIAVDLKGFTDGCRPMIFARRAAPIQVNYLGYPGTTGASCMDYIIADAEVIPAGHEVHYSEQVVRLPDSYQVNDTRRAIADHLGNREEMGLPASGFVFCCFNNNYKITPEVFDVWMRLLKAVPGSVLWLLEDNAAASRNLRREAQARGVDVGRLVFAGRVLPPAHLARHRLADLFLDTLPCNAHTTASDALWAGLPVLTCRGHAFAGRVAASLLRAAGLPELAVDHLDAYEALALRLATQPEELAVLKGRLLRNRLRCPLFDIDRYRRHLESAYTTMVEQHRQGLPPRGFNVNTLY